VLGVVVDPLDVKSAIRHPFPRSSKFVRRS
jgi:hypothetical protein